MNNNSNSMPNGFNGQFNSQDSNNKKNLIPIDEALNKDIKNTEILEKIKYFITHINPKLYKIDLNSSLFYNTEKPEVLEVFKNFETGRFAILNRTDEVFASEKVKEGAKKVIKTAVKIRKLMKGGSFNNSAFVQGSLLFTICIIMSILLSFVFFIFR